MNDVRWIISQIGSREHYSGPVGFQRRGTLRLFYTDIWCRLPRGVVAKIPGPFGRLSRRYHPELEKKHVVSFDLPGLGWEWKKSRLPQTAEAHCDYYLQQGQWFGTSVSRHLAKQRLEPKRDAMYIFSSGALETLRLGKERGIFTILNQLDPAKVDEDMRLEEQARWPGWESTPGVYSNAYYERLQEEWEIADQIVVNSHFSKQSIEQQGAKSLKTHVLPLAYESELHTVNLRRMESKDPLEVLWLGQIVLRKGIPYLFEAARQLLGYPVRFHVAGHIGISDEAIRSAPSNVVIHGKVSRNRAIQLFNDSHVFVLPTISDGFAITQIEAMSMGLPVIATPNCGDVVTDGVDGFIVPIRDPQAIAERIVQLIEDRSLLEQMSAKALIKSREFGLDSYTTRIERIYRESQLKPT